MRRIIAFLVIFAVLTTFAFGITVILYPAWLVRSGEAITLLQTIFVTGLGMVASGIMSWAISFLFEDKSFKERSHYLIGNKYRDISKKLDEITNFEIKKEKRSRRYIPDIFVESTEVKEKLRYFCEPFIFFSNIIEHTERTFQNSFIINLLEQIHLPIHDPKKPKIKQNIRRQKTLIQNIEKFNNYLEQKKSITDVLIKEGGTGLKPEYRSQIPSKYSHIYDYAYHMLQYYGLYEHEIKDAQDDLDLLTNKLVIIKGVAGHGKTNLLCDFTENFLLKKKHKILYIPAREFNYLGEQETIEQAIARITFTESDHQFSDILRLIKFDKNIDNLFILIDGINEHRNLALFSTALEQFMQRCSMYDIKVILTCRSEYFDDRFGNLLQNDNLSLLDIDDWKYAHEIPEVHQNALIARYFSEFNIQMQPDHVNPNIIETFYKDKLLLRIFCEAYENEQPADYLDDLYKLEIFNKYFERKLEAIEGLDSCLEEIITWMIEHDEFANNRIQNFSDTTIEVIEATAYENVILKKDIITTPGLAFGRAEVINFVYDEFRDFLIASRILLIWDQDNQQSRDQIQRYTEFRSRISEGVQKYLCLWGVKNDKRDLLNFLATMDWFDLVFIEAVFDTPDAIITDFIVDTIRALFASNSSNALHIIFKLLYRVRDDVYPNMNIDLLFNLINAMNEEEYQNVISVALNIEYDYTTSHITFLCEMIVNAFRENKISDATIPKIIQLLCYLIGIKDSKFFVHDRIDFGLYPAQDAIIELSNIGDEQNVLGHVRQVLQATTIESINNGLNVILEYFGEE